MTKDNERPSPLFDVYVSIGNSDDKLTQLEWSEYWHAVDRELKFWGRLHGVWLAVNNTPYQNAVWACEIKEVYRAQMREGLRKIMTRYNQDAIAWFEGKTDFVTS